MSLGRQMGSAKVYERLCRLTVVRDLGVVSPPQEDKGRRQETAGMAGPGS